MSVDATELEYVGFWSRVGATLVDSFLLCIFLWPLLYVIYGSTYWSDARLIKGFADLILSWLFPVVVTLWFWVKVQATPGKMAISARIVDASSGGTPRNLQFVGRYLAYFLSAIPMGLGFLWIAFDRRKRGWHDILAGTVVVRRRTPEPVTFIERPEG